MKPQLTKPQEGNSRRAFVKGLAATGLAGAFGVVGRAEAGVGDTYPGWNPGDLDLHFIYTGCGENMFYRLPDGTSILNDTGDFYRPKDLKHIPLLPSPDRLGGEWVSRYIQRVYPEKIIDYLMFSHWHRDHVGHASFDKKDTPDEAYRYKTFADGVRGNGFMCVAQDFGFRRHFDHQHPARGKYRTHDTSLKLFTSWVAGPKAKGLVCEPFKVGALNQIALLRDPGKYANFSIRNICANGRLWDGKDGELDYAAEYAARTGAKRISQNALSLGFVMQYGKFRFWSGGDMQDIPKVKKMPRFASEGLVGLRVGPVTLCKMNHHGNYNAMCEAFVRAVRAQTYVSCVWTLQHLYGPVFERLAAPEFNPGCDPLIIPNIMPQCKIDSFKGSAFLKNIPTRGAVHVVVKVLPGGSDYRVYLLDARDESMRIVGRFDRQA